MAVENGVDTTLREPAWLDWKHVWAPDTAVYVAPRLSDGLALGRQVAAALRRTQDEAGAGMTEQKIGAQLDELGLTVDLEDGDRVTEAVVTITTTLEDYGGHMRHKPVHVPTPELKPVP
ncbi:hypothetical protein [Streptomyces sp. LN699]|uniref:hypothetical protein n=1 Tax=Streptomyces sp. LN699 TaxID=3112981 RepID=UPI003711D47A